MCAKTLHSSLTLCDPIKCSLPGSCPWDSPGKNTRVGCHILLQVIFLTQGLNPHLYVSYIGRQVLYHEHHLESPVLAMYCACMLSHVQLFVTLWTLAHKLPLSMGFSRQEYWSGLPFPSPGDLPDPGIEPMTPVSPAVQADSLLLGHWGSQYFIL